ncbi:hypothetical protein BSKO_04284 [Bryopsis sp. KO-2023]|nr:hypothetical protein BSKO_04284 [Bryopsis sp. KO-2023]
MTNLVVLGVLCRGMGVGEPDTAGHMILLKVVALLAIAPIAFAQLQESELSPPTSEVCEDVRLVESSARCEFVRRNCVDESREASVSIAWLETYYCDVAGKLHTQLFFWASVLLLVVILFLLLGDTAEKFFSPTLTQISMEVPKMRPRFSGVTLLAFANGAPDLSATINAIKTCKFDMSLGALTGAGMFVNCFVAGFIILVSGGAKCRGATIRDVGAYMITILGLLIALAFQNVGLVYVIFSFLVYVGFVVMVFGADEWHEKGRPDFWSKPIQRISRSMRKNHEGGFGPDAAPVWATYEDDLNDPGMELSGFRFGGDHLDDALLPHSPRMPTIWASISSPSRYREQALAELAESDEMYGDQLEPLDEIDEHNEMQQDDDLSSRSYGSPRRTPAQMVPLETEFAEADSNQGGPLGKLVAKYPWVVPLWGDMLMEEWGEMSLVLKVLLVMRLPFVVLQRATIPMTSAEHYNRNWLVISTGLSPLFALYYFDIFSMQSLLVALLVGPIFSFIVGYLTKKDPNPPRWSLGTSWPIGAATVALYGLLMGAFWIDVIAGELVDLLHCIGVVLGIPGAILGLTVLAWGNSVGDFFTNKSVAKAGKGNMALTACYAGPVFNMLLGLAIGLLAFFISNHRNHASIRANPQVVLGCVFLLLHGGAVIGVGLAKGLRLPRRFGYFSIGLYVVYVAFAVGMNLLFDISRHDYSDQCG